MFSRYHDILAVPGVARLYASAIVARLPQGMCSLAVLLLVRGSTNSYAAAGLAVGAEALATAASAPVLGRLIDRLGRSRVISRCAAGYGLALCALVLAAQLDAESVALIFLAGVSGALLPPIAPAVRALLREVFTEEGARERAYALESVVQELIWITGPLIVAGAIAFFSPAVAVLLVAAACVLGVAWFLRGPLARDEPPARGPAERGAALASSSLRALLVPIFLTGMALGATEVGLPALALHASSRSAAGLLLALWSVGSILGGLWFGARNWRASLTTRYAVLLLIAVACVAPLIVAESLFEAILFSLLAGVTIAPVFSCQYALVGHAVRSGSENEAFTWVGAALVSGIAAGSAVGGLLVAGIGFSAPFGLAGAAYLCAAALASLVRGIDTRASAEPALATLNQ